MDKPTKKKTSYIQNKWIANSFAHKTIFNDTLNFKFEPIHKAKINITLTKSLNIKNVALKNQRSKSLLYWREVGNVEFHIRPSLLYKSYGIQVKNTILFISWILGYIRNHGTYFHGTYLGSKYKIKILVCIINLDRGSYYSFWSKF